MTLGLERGKGTEERAGREARPLLVQRLGLVPYASTWRLQKETADRVARGEQLDTLLLLQHPHTYTCGRSGGRKDILVSEQFLQQVGATAFDVDRGGRVTYHGPGQLVAYPILRLADPSVRPDYSRFVRLLEEAIIRTLREYAITSFRIDGLSGVWIGTHSKERKIAAVGVRVDSRNISTHGIALNLNPDLRFFSYIVPCGIRDRGVTSIAELSEHPPSMQELETAFLRTFCDLFGFTL